MTMNIKNVSEVREIVEVKPQDEIDKSIDELAVLDQWMRQMGISDYYVFDPSIVRGLAYYTGIVFEVHDIVGELRAICGGGRYDNLLHDFSGPAIPATGMGMGDCVLEILLREKGLLETQLPKPQLEFNKGGALHETVNSYHR